MRESCSWSIDQCAGWIEWTGHVLPHNPIERDLCEAIHMYMYDSNYVL